MEYNSVCKICGKQKESKVIPYIEKTVYIECQCEKELRLQQEAEKHSRAVQNYFEKRTEASHISQRDKDADLSKLQIDERNKKAIEAAKFISQILINDIPDVDKNGLILSGNRGSGKTYIAASVINEFNKKSKMNDGVIKDIIKSFDQGFNGRLDYKIGSKCRFIKEKEVVQLSERYSYRDEESPIDEYKKAKLLVIDDIGSYYADSKKIISALFDLIDYRYSQKLSTIITTNLSKDELNIYLGERSFDRLINSCHYIKLTSPESRRS